MVTVFRDGTGRSRPVPATNFRDGSIELASFAGPYGERGYDPTHAASYVSLARLLFSCTYIRVQVRRSVKAAKMDEDSVALVKDRITFSEGVEVLYV